MITASTVHTAMALISPFISIPGDQVGFVHLVRDTISHNQHAIWADMKGKGWKSKAHIPAVQTGSGDTEERGFNRRATQNVQKKP